MNAAKMTTSRRTVMVLAVLTVVVPAGCRGFIEAPTEVTDTSAELHAQAECLAETEDNPCTGWFQYWEDGSTAVSTTPLVEANVPTNGLVDFNQTVTGLTPGTVYHAQFCGFGDSNIAEPGLCTGPDAVTQPGSRPDPANYSAAQRFRTASAGTSATLDLGRVLSTADTADRPIARDGGLSVAYSDSKAVWVFGDTVQRNGPAFLALGTAAAGPYEAGAAPDALEELPRPPAPPDPGRTSPQNFFPAPQGLLTPDDPPVPCGSSGSESYSAAWLSGGARIPDTDHALLTWGEICVAIGEGRGWPLERARIAEYDPETNRFVRFATPFVADPLHEGLPVTKGLSSPVFGDDGYLYFFRADREAGAVYVLRVGADPAAWGDPANYRWWGRPGGGDARWTTDHTSAVSIVAGVVPWGVHVADFSSAGGGKKLAMLVKDSFGNAHFRIYTADSPLGPWTAGPVGEVPDNCQGGGFGCYAFYGHPELSTADSFVFSWYSPGDRGNDGGHVRVGAIDW